jgi:RHS repeat-associated protein
MVGWPFTLRNLTSRIRHDHPRRFQPGSGVHCQHGQRRQAGVGGGTGLVDAAITWDTAGNLLSRQDLKQSVTETFDYDALNRLTGSQRNGTQNLTLTYNAIGNLLTKSDVGSYTYHATKKRAVIQAGSTVYGYDANGNMTSRGGSSISYTSYNLPSLMNQGSNSSAVSYGAFRNRFKQVTAGSDPTTTIYVAGILERVTRPGGVTEFRHQIHGPTGTVAIYTRRSSGTADTYYLHRDHLGSPELITNAAGTQVVKPSFAAFGERRGSTWTGAPNAGDWTAIGNTTRDGFTDHEHLDSVGLIHMNGRVYDPKIGRFLSPDPFIDWGLGTQGVNRYGYVGNNPLNRIDPRVHLSTIGRHERRGGGGRDLSLRRSVRRRWLGAQQRQPEQVVRFARRLSTFTW